MSYSIPGVVFTLLSSGDMSSAQHHAVQASTTNSVDGAIITATRGGKVTGIAKVVAGDSSAMANGITAGLPVVASSVGRAVPSTAAGQWLIGIALEPLSTGSTGIIAVALAIGAIST